MKNKEMNILKALAIIAMVIGHSRGTLVANVYLYHMALFIFVSGYFYKEEYSYKPVKLIIKRIKSLYVPFVKFNIFILIGKVIILENIFIDKGNGVIKDFFTGIKNVLMFNHTDPLISAFWFLKSLFIVNILFCLISYIAIKLENKKMNREVIRAILNIIVYIIFYNLTKIGYLKNGEISFISRACVINVFFYLGFLYKKIEEKIKFNFIFFGISIIYIYVAAKYDTIDMYSFHFVSTSFLIISSVIGIYFNIYISKKILKSQKTTRILDYIGAKSIWILAYHIIMYKIAILIKIKIFNLDVGVLGSFPTFVVGRYDWWLDVFMGVTLPIILCFMFEKIIRYIKLNKSNDSVNFNMKKIDWNFLGF